MIIRRRTFLTGLLSALAAPAIVRAGSLMPVKQMLPLDLTEANLLATIGEIRDFIGGIPQEEGWIPCDGRWLHPEVYGDLVKHVRPNDRGMYATPTLRPYYQVEVAEPRDLRIIGRWAIYGGKAAADHYKSIRAITGRMEKTAKVYIDAANDQRCAENCHESMHVGHIGQQARLVERIIKVT